MNEIKFIVKGKPVAKGRPRFTRSGHAYTPQKTRDYESIVAWLSTEAMGDLEPFDGVCKVSIKAFFKTPKTGSKNLNIGDGGNLAHIKRPDCDNIAKIICDSMNGIVYKDDAQIYSLNIEKLYSDIERVEVTVNFFK